MNTSTTTSAIRTISFLIVAALVVVACGQKSGVHLAGSSGGVPGTVTDPVTGEPVTGGVTDPVTGEPITGGQPGTTPGETGGPAPPPAEQPVGPGDRTGITDTTITIGLHAPETGAAPIQAEVFDKGKDLYWKWLHNDKGQKVFGREVRVVSADDGYSPTQAVSVCNEMARSSFLLIGGAGTDQINACANFADQRGIPYLSPGVQEEGLNVRRTYFAVSMTYRAQMKPFIQLLKSENKGNALNKYGDSKVRIGFVRPNTPNFNDAAEALKAEAEAAGFEYRAYSVVKEGSSSEAVTVAAQLEDDDVDVVVPITAPTFTVQLAINTGKNEYFPKYAGVAITNNINQMIARACNPGKNEFHGAIFFSPWPGWREVNQGKYDPEFSQAANKYAREFNNSSKGGDLLLALWGIMKNVHQMMLATGPTMSRESFVATVAGFKFNPAAFPTLACSQTDHFCARDTFVLLGDCDADQWVTHPNYPKKRSSF